MTSEAGKPLRFINPWQRKKVKITRNGQKSETLAGERLEVKTAKAENIVLAPE